MKEHDAQGSARQPSLPVSWRECGTGLLLAPQSSARTRRQLHSLTQDLQEETSHMLGDGKRSIGKAIEQGKSRVGVGDREVAT